jgi:hypothetical protein
LLAGGLAAKRIPRLVARCSIVAILTAVVSGAYFAIRFPGVGGASIGYGLFLFFAAIMLGIGAAITTLRMLDPT